MRRSLIVLGMLAACSGGDSTSAVVRAGPPSAVVVVSGDGQQATVASALPQAIRVRVNDAQGLAITEQLVNFVVTKGGGSVFAGSSLTDDKGEAQDFWTLGPIAGDQELEARAIQNGLPVVLATITAKADPGPLSSSRFTLDTLLAEEGTPATIVTEGFDAFGNTVAPPTPAALDPQLGLVQGQQWTPAGFGRARFALGGDTLVAFVRMKGGAFRARYEVGQWYTAVATLRHDPAGNPDNCAGAPVAAPKSFAVFVADTFTAWNADSSTSFSWHRLEHFLCQDLRTGTFTGQLRYYWPDNPGGSYVGHLAPITLQAVIGPVLEFSTGTFGPDTVTVTR